ncbi:hypothetical protein ABZ807_10575 [Micromonospora sp. NPDC047548]|uniref:hypothetical protein n=1 Tax=Micromonospora sp. NPDC047548 TaxID=3155624 RepID=UPI0033F4BC27
MSSWRWHGRAANTALVLVVGLVALVGLVVQSHGIDTAAEWAALLAAAAGAANPNPRAGRLRRRQAGDGRTSRIPSLT